jgi:hypothetical protein
VPYTECRCSGMRFGPDEFYVANESLRSLYQPYSSSCLAKHHTMDCSDNYYFVQTATVHPIPEIFRYTNCQIREEARSFYLSEKSSSTSMTMEASGDGKNPSISPAILEFAKYMSWLYVRYSFETLWQNFSSLARPKKMMRWRGWGEQQMAGTSTNE